MTKNFEIEMDKMTIWECVKQLLTAFGVLLLALIFWGVVVGFAVMGIAAILQAVGGLLT